MASKRDYYGNIRAPEFPAGLEWFNTGKPLTLAQLRGKLVLLDFWTYGCINCIHIIPDLKRLEALFPDELVVIGVHSAKFANESGSENIRQIILRYELEHPVVNDKNFEVWRAYAVRAWPTTILLDPQGHVLAAHSGEGVWEAYHELIASSIEEYALKGLLDRRPTSLLLERSHARPTLLSFPGKILATEERGQLYIADSNHHRIVITDLAGTVQEVIGAGARGLADGPFEEARFAKPQGMALDGDRLYIADTENHRIALADLATRTVRTLAGNGTLGYRGLGGTPLRTALNSPWDLVLVGRKLYIAMAGLHQIWELRLDEDWVGPYAGSGREGLVDGPLAYAALAQPSGIATDGKVLFFADSEASAIRVADLAADGAVRTIIGEGLFEFGDIDGARASARLQHALGIIYHRGALYVADTYNHKIKLVDPVVGRATTWLGSGTPGNQDAPTPQFYEPGGVAVAREMLYIADTNNHAIRVADLASRRVTTLALSDPHSLLTRHAQGHLGATVRLPAQQVRPGEGMVRVQVALPKGTKLTEGAPSFIVWETNGNGVLHLESGPKTDLTPEKGPLELKAHFAPGRTLLQGEVSLNYCLDARGLCLTWPAHLEMPVTVTEEAKGSEIEVTLQVAPSQ